MERLIGRWKAMDKALLSRRLVPGIDRSGYYASLNLPKRR
jgi:hypothetical protein